MTETEAISFEVKRLKDEFKELLSEYEKKKQEIKDLESDKDRILKEKSLESDKLSEKIASLDKIAKLKEKQISDLDKSIESKESECRLKKIELDNEVRDRQVVSRNLFLDYINIKEKMDNTKSELDKIGIDILKKQSDLSDLNKLISEATEKLKGLNTDIDNAIEKKSLILESIKEEEQNFRTQKEKTDTQQLKFISLIEREQWIKNTIPRLVELYKLGGYTLNPTTLQLN